MNIYKAISANIWKSYLILLLFIVFAGTVAYVIGEASGYGHGLGIGIFVGAVFYSFISYFYSDKMVLATTGAKQIQKKDNPQLFHLIENLSIGNGVPMPKVYIMDDPSPNAFATGRDPKHAAVAVTTGILTLLNKTELEGVLAHELSHVKNYDTRLLAITAVLVGFIALITDLFMRSFMFGGFRNDNRNSGGQAIFLVVALVLAILAPIVASLIQLAISRKREFLADASGALLTRYPEGLASALEKISADPHPLKHASNATAHLFIMNPFKEKKGFSSWVAGLFSTHPPAAERIKILRGM